MPDPSRAGLGVALTACDRGRTSRLEGDLRRVSYAGIADYARRIIG